MTSATIGIALDLRSTPPDELFYLAVLPTLLTEVGVIRDGTPLSYEQMRSRLRREILALDAYFSTNFATGRAELTVRAAGNDAAEAEAAVGWMRSVLAAPDWRPD